MDAATIQNISFACIVAIVICFGTIFALLIEKCIFCEKFYIQEIVAATTILYIGIQYEN